MIKENIKSIEKKINGILLSQNRKREDIILLAVTKTHPAKMVDEALKAGITHIGENKIQEATQKIPLLKEKYQEFHFIGHLQSNKIKKLMSLKPALIHSIDKYETAEKLNEYLRNIGRNQNILVQINTSMEESKFGIEPKDAINFIEKTSKLGNVKIKGLMTIGKFTSDKEEIRENFRRLRDIFLEIKQRKIINVEMKYLSMGMSGDYEIALEEGANILRIGSAIFGERNYNPKR